MSRKKNHGKRAARSKAFQVLYSLEFLTGTSLDDIRTAFTALPDPSDADMDENPVETRSNENGPAGFAWEIVEGVWSHADELDRVIEQFSHNWRLDRLGKVELTLLRMALFEMIHRADIPLKVTINEALELSALFADYRAGKFINGVLDAAAGAVEAGTLPACKKIR